MSRLPIVALLAAGVLVPLAAARADCAYDIAQLNGKLAYQSDKAKVAAVRKELAKAEAARRTSETECRNAVTRGWAAYRAAPEVPARAANAPNYSVPK